MRNRLSFLLYAYVHISANGADIVILQVTKMIFYTLCGRPLLHKITDNNI